MTTARRLALSLAGVLALATSAHAADMARPITKAPAMVAAAYDWSGFYIGAFAGGAGADRNAVSTEPATAAGVPYNVFSATPNSYSLTSSWIGGGTIGYNWQAPGSNWVVGLEAEAGYLRLRRSVIDVNAAPFGNDSIDATRLGSFFGDITGRVGIAWNSVLLYGKGGVAFVDRAYSFRDNCTTAPCGGATLNIARSRTDVTWTAGAGAEFAVAPNWTIKGEYMYIDTRETFTQAATASTGPVFGNSHTDPGIHTGKIGLNYKWGGPVVARY